MTKIDKIENWKIVYIDTKKKKPNINKYSNIFDISWKSLSRTFT